MDLVKKQNWSLALAVLFLVFLGMSLVALPEPAKTAMIENGTIFLYPLISGIFLGAFLIHIQRRS